MMFQPGEESIDVTEYFAEFAQAVDDFLTEGLFIGIHIQILTRYVRTSRRPFPPVVPRETNPDYLWFFV